MNPDDYKRVKEIFNSVLEIEPEGRGAFLDERCDGENGLRDEVERLLRSHHSEFLETPAVAPFAEDVIRRSSHSGHLIGHYSVITKIGSGGMGDVYLAEDGKLGRRVAIKILPKEFTTDADRLSRFHLEARSASSLTHPNILTIHEIGEWEGTHYIATEYVEGETLRHRLSRGRLGIDESLEYGVQIVSAVAAAHEAGVTHRDIKPENIMIRRDGLIKILDFGLAKFSGPLMVEALPVSNDGPTVRIVNTEPGIIMGTVQYMSPEQARGQITDGRTDIWSLGCVLYEMLAGSPPFSGGNSADLIAEIVKTYPKSLSEFDPEIPERLDEIVAKSLEKNPDERYQTAKDLLIDLKRLRRRFDFEGGSELLDPAVATDPGNGAVTGPNLINTKSGPKDLTTVRGTEYFIWGIKAHRVMSVGIGLLIAALVGGTVYLVRNYWKGPIEVRIEYANKIRLAAEALETSNLAFAKQLLDETRPKNGGEDLRDFEWGYLARLHAERMASQPITLKNEAWVHSVAFSADSKSLATGSSDARLWDVSTGQQTAEFKGHSKPLVSVAISADGTKLVTGSFDLSAKLWEISTKKLLWTIDDPRAGIAMGRLAFSSDGQRLYTETAERKIRSWDTSTGKEISDQKSFHGLRHPFAWSPDGKYIAGQTQRGWEIDVKEIATGRTVTTLKRDIGFVTDVSFAPNSKLVLVRGSEGIAFLWELPSGKQIRKFDGVTCEPSFSPNGKSIAMCSKNVIKLWDLEKSVEIAFLRGHIGEVKAIAFSPDGLKLASGGDDNTAKIWNVPPSETRGILRGHTKEINGISFSHDSKLLASASEDNSVKIWDVETEQVRRPLVGHTDVVISTAFSPDERTVATIAKDRKVKIWDITTGKQLRSFDIPTQDNGISYSPNGKLIATSNWWDGTDVKLWDAATGDLRCSFPIKAPWGVRFSKNGSRVTASGDDKTVKLWDTSTCAKTWVFNKESDFNYFVVFTPDDKLMAFQRINDDRSLQMIDTESGRETVTFSGHDEQLSTADTSMNGNRLITSDGAGSIKIWDIATGQVLLTIKTGSGRVAATAMSPDGLNLATGGSDGTIKLWRAQPLK